jgi:hypothetical protein
MSETCGSRHVSPIGRFRSLRAGAGFRRDVQCGTPRSWRRDVSSSAWLSGPDQQRDAKEAPQQAAPPSLAKEQKVVSATSQWPLLSTA